MSSEKGRGTGDSLEMRDGRQAGGRRGGHYLENNDLALQKNRRWFARARGTRKAADSRTFGVSGLTAAISSPQYVYVWPRMYAWKNIYYRQGRSRRALVCRCASRATGRLGRDHRIGCVRLLSFFSLV